MKKLFFIVAGQLFFILGSAQEYISNQTARQEYAQLLKQRAFIAFPELREQPIRWLDSVKKEWLEHDYAIRPFVLHPQPGEYFVFQTGIWAISKELKKLGMSYSDFKTADGRIISSDRLTCFNAGGTDFRGRPFRKELDIPGQEVQSLWIGISVPETAKGIYTGMVTLSVNGDLQKIKIQLDIQGPAIADHGFDEGRRLARLSWLNSRAGLNDAVTKGYLPVKREGHLIRILGRSLEIAGDGLPADIRTYFTPSNQSVSKQGASIIQRPFHFIIEKENGEIIRLKPGLLKFGSQVASGISWSVTSESADCDLVCHGELAFDGFADYHLTVKAKKLLDIKDIRLELAMNKDHASYMMGLNKSGGLRPENWDWKWDAGKNQDALWLGAVNGGLRIKWKAENYARPLVNVYYHFGELHLPPSWCNNGKGGVHVAEKQHAVLINGYSGNRSMQKGEQQHFDFELLITPFKIMDRQVQYGARYFHSGSNKNATAIQTADSLGANIINIHHGNELYPFINYPYSDINVNSLKAFISAGHRDNKRVKVYYTTRELTINLPELWPFVSLNGEIIYPGPGASAKTVTNAKGPDVWLKENLRGRKYIPAWVAYFDHGKFKGLHDLSVITTPDSRLNNFYVAGLDWMVHHLQNDGIYIDDCSMDRTTISRARKILDSNRPNANIDMHSWDHFNKYAGYASCLNLYMDLLPYIDQLWIGEARNYDTPPDYWLVEISGIPFGLPGQMLQDGGNPWRGMVYGMTNRAGWTGTPPDQIWRFWDRNAIQKKSMIGYWDPEVPVKSNNDSVKVTVYTDSGGTILSVGNFSGKEQCFNLSVDYKKLGLDPQKCRYSIPQVDRFQIGESLQGIPDHMKVPAGKGYLILISPA